MDDRDKAGKKAAEKYNRAAEEFAETDKGERAADEAKRALDSGEAADLRRAEKVGRAPKDRK